MDYKNFIQNSKELVARFHNDRDENQLQPDDIYIVWYCKTLQNVKALLSTPVSDGMYYEVTYNGDKNETYFDAYRKVENVVVKGVE